MLHERRSKLVASRVSSSTATPVAADCTPASRAGADLREARERLGLSLQEVSLTLRIRVPYLEALEEGRLTSLPGSAYALAFVRTYATALGLDAEEMVRRFKTEAGEFGRRTELVFPVPMPERGMPPGAVVLLGLVLAVGAYAGWYRLSGEGRLPAEAVTAIPERLAPLAAQALVLGPGAGPGTGPGAGPGTAAPGSIGVGPLANADLVTLPRTDLAEPSPAIASASPAPPVAAISPSSAAAAQLPPRPTDLSAVTGLAPAVAAADTGRIVLRASSDAWMMVKDRGGSILLNRTMKTGDSWAVPPRPDLLLTTGNAGGTDILIDGVAAPSLGASGAVRRDVALDPDQIRDGKLVGATMPQVVSTRPRQ